MNRCTESRHFLSPARKAKQAMQKHCRCSLTPTGRKISRLNTESFCYRLFITVWFGEQNMARKYLILTIFGLCCVLLFQPGCQQPSDAVAEPKTTPQATVPTPTPTKVQDISADRKGPQITFEKLVHDFGSVGANTRNTYKFNFTNTGDKLLKIREVKPSCPSCTTTRLSRKECAPGESGTLKVSYDVGKRPGPTKKYVYVSSNDKANPKIKLTVEADIALKVDYEPRILNLSLRDENAACPQITIKSLDNQPFAIKSFKSTNDLITADYNESEEKTNFVFQPKVGMEKLRKTRRGRIDIALTHPQLGNITIPFNVLPEFSISPPRLILLKAEPQKPLTREIWFVNIKGGRKLKLTCTGFYQKTPAEPQGR